MAKTQFYQPDEEAMEKLLREYRWQPTGVILFLAWREGLARNEISELTWEQVDFDAMLLRLPDREVPLEPDVAEMLEKWRLRCERFSPYVAVSDRLRKRLVPQSMTTLARHALDSAGQTEVRLQDLRYDYIRRQFAIHDWPYVLRIAGISLSTYRAGLHKLVPAAAEPRPEPEPQDDVGEEFKLWRVLQAERSSPAGIALWLSTQLGLQCEEIVRLTWEAVDFDAAALRLPDRSVPLTTGVGNILREEFARRAPGDDPHIILTPRSRGPMQAARLTTVVRSVLIRGGIEDRTMLDFHRDPVWEAQREKLRAHLTAHGSVTRKEASELLDLSTGQTYTRLTRMTESGELVRMGSVYYPAGAVIAPEKREEAVLDHIAVHGPAYRREIEALLRVGRHKATAILNELVNAGELTVVPGSWKYALAKSNNSINGRRTDSDDGKMNLLLRFYHRSAETIDKLELISYNPKLQGPR